MKIKVTIFSMAIALLGLMTESSFGKGLKEVSKNSNAAQKANRSDLSASLDKKLYILTSYGFAQVTGDSGSWKSGGASDIEVGYLLLDGFMGEGLWATFRYVPFAVAPTIKKDDVETDFIGNVDGWYFGALTHLAISKDMKLALQAELGILDGRLYPDTSYSGAETPESSGAGVALSTGMDFEIAEKATIGPRLRLGFGTLSTVQLNAAFSFMF